MPDASGASGRQTTSARHNDGGDGDETTTGDGDGCRMNEVDER